MVIESNESKFKGSGGWAGGQGVLFQRNSEPHFQEHYLTKGRTCGREDKNGTAISQRQKNSRAHHNGLLQFKYTGRCSKGALEQHTSGDRLAMWPRLCKLAQNTREEETEDDYLTVSTSGRKIPQRKSGVQCPEGQYLRAGTCS